MYPIMVSKLWLPAGMSGFESKQPRLMGNGRPESNSQRYLVEAAVGGVGAWDAGRGDVGDVDCGCFADVLGALLDG